MDYQILRKTGRLTNGNERGCGHIYHAVKNHTALCGAMPGKRGGWGIYEGEKITCPRCLKKIQK